MLLLSSTDEIGGCLAVAMRRCCAGRDVINFLVLTRTKLRSLSSLLCGYVCVRERA
jgi:hypothetical protein